MGFTGGMLHFLLSHFRNIKTKSTPQNRLGLYNLLDTLTDTHHNPQVRSNLLACKPILRVLLVHGVCHPDLYLRNPHLQLAYREVRGTDWHQEKDPLQGLLAFIGAQCGPSQNKITLNANLLWEWQDLIHMLNGYLPGLKGTPLGADLSSLKASYRHLAQGMGPHQEAAAVYLRHTGKELELESDPLRAVTSLINTLLCQHVTDSPNPTH